MLDREFSRRQLLVRSAATAAGLSLSMSVLAAQRAKAKVDPAQNPSVDRTLLLDLLAGEWDAIATYMAGATIIGADTVTPQATRDTVGKVAAHFLAQHTEHASAIAMQVTLLGGTVPAQNTTPTLPAKFKSIQAPTTTDVLKLAVDKEKAAAIKYAAVMQQLSIPMQAQLAASIGAVETQHFVVLYLLAEGFIQANANTNAMADLVVPGAFVLDNGTTSLSNNPALDNLLKLTPKT